MNIYEKMLTIYKNVQYLAKDDNVEFAKTKYKALSEEKVTSIMRKQMVEQGLIVFPVWQESSRNGNISHVNVRYRIVNVENPEEFIEVVSAGDGADTQDKGCGKAMTYAFKYIIDQQILYTCLCQIKFAWFLHGVVSGITIRTPTSSHSVYRFQSV